MDYIEDRLKKLERQIDGLLSQLDADPCDRCYSHGVIGVNHYGPIVCDECEGLGFIIKGVKRAKDESSGIEEGKGT